MLVIKFSFVVYVIRLSLHLQLEQQKILMNANMQQGEFLQILLPESQVPAITGTTPTPSGRQLMKTAILVIGRNNWFSSNHSTIPLDITGFT